jgi:hypothetical protein
MSDQDIPEYNQPGADQNAILRDAVVTLCLNQMTIANSIKNLALSLMDANKNPEKSKEFLEISWAFADEIHAEVSQIFKKFVL